MTTSLNVSSNNIPNKHVALALAERERRRRQRVQSSTPSFRGDNQVAQATTAPEWILSGPAETGKTWATLYRLDTEARKWPNSQWAILRKVRADMDSTVLNTWRKVIAIRGGVSVYGGERPQWYDYPNGARVWIGGMDNPGKTLSGERDGVYFNQAEEANQEDWEYLTTRTTGRGAVTDTPMLFGDCNPGPADHWILRRRDSGALQLLYSTHKDNPALYDDDGNLTAQGQRSLMQLSMLTGVRKLRLKNGQWVGAEGQYFEQWDEALHVCAPFVIPADWMVWGAFDYGTVHNTAFGVFTKHQDDVYLLGEHVQNKWLIKQHAAAMDALLERLGIAKTRLRRIVAGHDVFGRHNDTTHETIADQYRQHGYHFTHASVDRINGATAIAERLGNIHADVSVPVTFRVFNTCHRTIATLPAMVHDPRRPEDVLKIDADAEGSGGDDCYDMVRYGLMDVRGGIAVQRPQHKKVNIWKQM